MNRPTKDDILAIRRQMEAEIVSSAEKAGNPNVSGDKSEQPDAQPDLSEPAPGHLPTASTAMPSQRYESALIEAPTSALDCISSDADSDLSDGPGVQEINLLTDAHDKETRRRTG